MESGLGGGAGREKGQKGPPCVYGTSRHGPRLLVRTHPLSPLQRSTAPGAILVSHLWCASCRTLICGHLHRVVRCVPQIRKEYTGDPDFTPANAAKASSAAEGLCKWVYAMDQYDRVAKVRTAKL